MPLVDVSAVSNSSYDFIVIGGGTAGLVVATRLSEDPTKTVLVIEAGKANLEDPKILIPAQYGATFKNPQYDWDFSTIPQQHCHNREFSWARGKGLGGTSAMNFYTWSKPPSNDIDAFEKLGNLGWNWREFDKFTKGVESFHPPTSEVTDAYPHVFDGNLYGKAGPIQVTIPFHFHAIDHLFQKAMQNQGLRAISNPYGGDITGTFISSSNLDPKNWTRSYTANSYLQPNLRRENLTVLTDALVSRILFAPAKEDPELRAHAVEFFVEGESFIAYVSKEVILSAGAINDPKILELSGIGRSDVLSRVGVTQLINLPGVGENVQEHNHTAVSFELDSESVNHLSLDMLRDPDYAAEAMKLHKLGQGLLRTGITSFAYYPLALASPENAADAIQTLEKTIATQTADGLLSASMQEQLALQIATLKDETQPDCEMTAFPGFFTTLSTPEPGKRYVTLVGFLSHPFSRGSIHAQSSDATVQPDINPRYFENDFDLENLVNQIKFMRKIANSEPWKSGTVREVDPGPEVTSDEDIRTYIKDFHSSTWHTVGSCSMLPREKDGVVDPTLKVYGTKNLRVVDISIVPLHVAAHTQTTAYFIGEKAADIIKTIHGGV